jgi:DNA-binding winged helix-turn-helix (wHTH) protein
MRYSFADCLLDTTSREFSRNGEEIHLSPKAYDLLLLLVEHRPRVMTKQELMEALWPGTFVVEANLPVLIGELRDALGEKTRGGVIKTHHGIGYSFAAEVDENRSRPASSRTSRTRIFLVVDGERQKLVPGEHQVGREPDCEVFLNHPDVSRCHARITVEGASVTVEDLDSKNGTLVNGKLLKKSKRLVNGDTLTFGTVETTIEIWDSSPSTITIAH